MHPLRRQQGFTLVELAIAAGILMLAIAVAMRGFLFVLKGASLADAQNELDSQVQTAMENIKAHARLSSLDEMAFYPPGPGPYTAISFPTARDDDRDGAVDLDEHGKIIWDATLIYHVWSGNPTELRLTTFDPRDNTLTPAQRQEQLNAVVAAGNGAGTFNGSNATTRVVFANLFDWSIVPRSSTYDGYAPQILRDVNTFLGSCLLTGGTHTFTFTVDGKNPASSGYRVGLDRLMVSPCAAPREAEEQLPASAQVGATAAREYMGGGSWSGNYQLSFPASATGHTFTLSMENDRWEDTNFRGLGSETDNTVVDWDTTLNPTDFVVRLDGYGFSWNAWEQTGETNALGQPVTYGYSDTDDSLRGCAVRVVLRGSEMLEGNWLKYSGGKSWVWFQAGGTGTIHKLRIVSAYIAECVATNDPTPDIVPGSAKRLAQWAAGPTSYELSWGQGLWTYSDLADFSIDRRKSYVVSFLVDSAANKGNARYWIESRDSAQRGCFLITNAAPADVTDPAWSARSDVLVSPRLYAVQYLYTSYPSNGVYTSQILDTQHPAPNYSAIEWSAVTPGGTYLGLRVRSGHSNDLSDAVAWTNIALMTAPGAISPGSGRYVQYQAVLRPTASGWDTPKLKNVAIRWPGETRVVDIGGTFTKGPDYGVFSLKVNGNELRSGLNANLSIFKDVRGYGDPQRLTSALTAELLPRNTGR